MQPNTPKKPTDPIKLVIHHLSDIHGAKDKPGLTALQQYVRQTVDSTDKPDIVVITGDLTLTGKKAELDAVAQELRTLNNGLRDSAKDHAPADIYIIPGTSDLEWNDKDVHTTGFRLFDDAMVGTGMVASDTPRYAEKDTYGMYLVSSSHRPLTKIPPTSRRHNDKTPLTPDELATECAIQFATIHRNNRDEMTIMAQMENLMGMDVGQISLEALERVLRPNTNRNQLRILAAYHPLIAFATRQQYMPAPINGEQILELGRAAGVHLLLHGHAHGAHVMSYVLPSPNPDQPAHTFIQIGGGSFVGNPLKRDEATYNVITAYRDTVLTDVTQSENPLDFSASTSGMQLDNFWRIEQETVTIRPKPATTAKAYFLIGNAPRMLVDASQWLREREERYTLSERFAAAMDRILHQLAAMMQGYSTQDKRRLFGAIQACVSQIVFANQDVSCGLLEKLPRPEIERPFELFGHKKDDKDTAAPDAPTDAPAGTTSDTSTLPELKFSPDMLPRQDIGPIFQNGLPYPATMAAWSLIENQLLIYPYDYENGHADMRWLIRNNKLEKVRKALGLAIDALNKASDKDDDEIKRLTDLKAMLSSATTTTHVPYRMIFRQADKNLNGNYKIYISVPVPHRDTEFEEGIKDLGVIQIDLKDDNNLLDETYFNSMRRRMLKMISNVVWLILVTTEALDTSIGDIKKREEQLAKYRKSLQQIKEFMVKRGFGPNDYGYIDFE